MTTVAMLGTTGMRKEFAGRGERGTSSPLGWNTIETSTCRLKSALRCPVGELWVRTLLCLGFTFFIYIVDCIIPIPWVVVRSK